VIGIRLSSVKMESHFQNLMFSSCQKSFRIHVMKLKKFNLIELAFSKDIGKGSSTTRLEENILLNYLMRPTNKLNSILVTNTSIGVMKLKVPDNSLKILKRNKTLALRMKRNKETQLLELSKVKMKVKLIKKLNMM